MKELKYTNQFKMKRFFYGLMIIGVLFPTIAKADSWLTPRGALTYYSENREYKLIVNPKFVPPKYYRYSYKSNKHPKSKRFLRKKEKLEQEITPCIAELYRRSETGSTLIWKQTLLNDVCPVYAIVANDGSSVATFDNWGSKGYGKNVFVVYNENGEAKRSYELEEISLFRLNDYKTTRSSIHWLAAARFSDNERIEIVFEPKSVSAYARSFSTSFILSKQLVSIYTESPTKRVYNIKSLEFEK